MAEAVLAAAALAAAAAEWLRQRWLRQRRRLVSGGLGLCFCGFLAVAAAAMFLASAAGGDLCLWWPRLVFLRLRRFSWPWLVFLAAAAEIGVLCLCFCQLRRWLVFLAPVAEPRVTDGLGCGRDFCFWRPLLVLQQQQSLCVAILLTYIVHS